MSNRVDFFQSEQTRLVLPAARVSVLLDGALCSILEPVEIVREGWPDFGWARLAYNPAACTEAELIAVEDIETVLAMGKSVRTEQVYNGGAPGAAVGSYPIFVGQIECMETRLGPDGERVEVIVRDFSAVMERVTIYGQRVADAEGSTLFLPGQDTVFNPDRKPNASSEPAEVNGGSHTIFCAEPSQAKLWGYAEVIDYLLSEYLVAGELHRPSVELLRPLTKNQIVRDLDVTGLSLMEALHRCCERVGLKIKFVVRPVPTGPKQAIDFYRDAAGREVELNCQQRGEQLSISKTNITGLHSKKNFWPVTHRYVGQGDFKVYEATFELVKAWEPAAEDTDYDKFSPSTNAEFYKVKDVYRKWCLNEAGDYSGEPYNQGEAFDFSKIFEGGNYTARRRRFRPCLTTDKQGRSLGYFVEVSYDNGQHWWQYLYAFNNLLDECGIWLSSDRLDVNTWVAALKGVLKFRITASVVSDERLSCAVADGPVGSAAPVVEQVITLPRWFKYRQVSAQSIFANSSDGALGQPDEVDDTDALYEFIRHRASVGAATIETVDVQTPYLAFDYRLGDKVTCCPASRDLLSCRSDNRSVRWIERVRMDFQKQCTNLTIVRKRMQRL